jgi:hypothetical protein
MDVPQRQDRNADGLIAFRAGAAPARGDGDSVSMLSTGNPKGLPATV